MKKIIKDLIFQAALRAHKEGELPSGDFPEITVEEPKVESQGDFSTNMAMIMAKLQKMAPVKIAGIIIKYIEDPDSVIEKAEVAGPGFINFFINKAAWLPVIDRVFDEGGEYGSSDFGKGTSVMVEFVSANPTGPLHVGHGRGAVVGDTVANVLTFCGFDVKREYYINDSGRQIKTLGTSVYLRYLELFGREIDFPDDCYQGDYIVEIAEAVRGEKGDLFLEADREEGIGFCARFAAKRILGGISDDLKAFGIGYDVWFSEQTLYDSGKVDGVIEELKRNGIVYENDGAQWFRTSDYGDEKDRVVVRSNGQTTYFASDIAYHRDKFDRGFNRLIDVWGADHHGYIPRINASINALDRNSDDFDVVLVQLVNLLRDGVPVAMSTRAGEFETLKDVVDEVGADAARFIFLTRHHDSPLDFDLELAKRKTNDNPVYYVQYVHARICSILRKASQERGIAEPVKGDAGILRLREPEEIGLIKAMGRYPQVVEFAGRNLEPHRITYYLMNLASLFHAYYNKHRVLTEDDELTAGRLYLIKAVRTVIQNGLALLGVSAPQQM